MKKILYILFIGLIFVNTVYAEESITNSKWQEEKLKGTNVETEYRYRFYKENIVGEYIKQGLESNYEYEAINDIKYGEYSDYNTDCISKPGYQIEEGIKYEYQKLLPVRYIKFLGVNGQRIKIKYRRIRIV